VRPVARCLCLKRILLHVRHAQSKVIAIRNMELVAAWAVAAAATNFFYQFKRLTDIVSRVLQETCLETFLTAVC
jgi:hypothetical protein